MSPKHDLDWCKSKNSADEKGNNVGPYGDKMFKIRKEFKFLRSHSKKTQLISSTQYFAYPLDINFSFKALHLPLLLNLCSISKKIVKII